MSTMSSRHLPSVTAVSIGPLVLVVSLCFVLEVLIGLVLWRVSRVARAEADMLSHRQTLKAGISKTDYSSTFVENSKLRRLLLKVEKSIEKEKSAKEKRRKSTEKVIRAIRVCVYGTMVVLTWGHPLICLTPDYLWPSCFSHALSGGRVPGNVGALSIVAMFLFGLTPLFGLVMECVPI
ncbi:unnamed protein product [Ascophyllum nodosum]